MTFFLSETPTPMRRGPDEELPTNGEGIGAAMRSYWQSVNVGFQRERQVIAERDLTATEAARRLGSEGVSAFVTEFNQRADASGQSSRRLADGMAPEELVAAVGPNGSKRLLEMARDKAAADPDAFKGTDLSDEGVEARVTAKRQAEAQADAEILALSPNPVRNSLIGSLGAGLVDPVNLALVPFGLGGGSILRVMAREALLGSAAEAIQFPTRVNVAEELQQEAPGFVRSLVEGAIGGAVLGGIFEGVPRAFRAAAYMRRMRQEAAVPGLVTQDAEVAVQTAGTAMAEGKSGLDAAVKAVQLAPTPRREPLILDSQIAPLRLESPSVTATTPEPTALAPDPITTAPLGEPTRYAPPSSGLENQINTGGPLDFSVERRALAAEDNAMRNAAIAEGRSVSRADENPVFTVLSALELRQTGGAGVDLVKAARVAGRDDLAKAVVDLAQSEVNLEKRLLDEKLADVEYRSEDESGWRKDVDRQEARIAEAEKSRDAALAEYNSTSSATESLPPAQGEAPQTTGELAAMAEGAIGKPAAAPRGQPTNLSTFIVQNGGIWKGDDRGDLAAMEYRRPGFLKKEKFARSTAGDNGGGRTIDEMRELATQAGYLPEGSGINDLLDALSDERTGLKRSALGEAASGRQEFLDPDYRPETAYVEMRPADGGLFIDLNARQFDDPDWQAGIERDFDGFVEAKGHVLLPREREEILSQLKVRGGEAEDLIYRAQAREVDEAEQATLQGMRTEAFSGNAVPWGDEAEMAPTASAAGGGSFGASQTAPGNAPQPGTGAGQFPTERTAAGEQSFIPGSRNAPTVDKGRQAAELAARQLQSKIRRLNQARVEDDVNGLFATKTMDLFDDVTSPKAKAYLDAQMASLRAETDMFDMTAIADDGTELTSLQDVIDEIDEMDTLAAEFAKCRTGATE